MNIQNCFRRLFHLLQLRIPLALDVKNLQIILRIAVLVRSDNWEADFLRLRTICCFNENNVLKLKCVASHEILITSR